jgi:PAS domain S-box-containing protein
MNGTGKTKEELLQEIAELRQSLGELEPGGGVFEECFQSLIENSFDVVNILDAKGVLHYVSPAVEHVLGYTPDETLGRDGFEFVHPDDLDKARDVLSRIVERGGTHYLDLRLLHKDGSARMVECVAQNLLDDPCVKGIVLNYRDITERKNAEEALRLSEEKFSKAFHSTPDSVTLTDIGNGRIIEVNEGFERIMGYSHDEIVGTTALEIQLWVDPDDRVRLVNRLLDEGAVRHFETRLRRRDGNIRSCVMSAETIQLDTGPCMLAVSRDITEHKEAEMLLWEIAERLKLEREESSQKDAALKQILAHIDKEKTAYKQGLLSSVENLIAPLIKKLRTDDGHITAQDIDSLESGLEAITGGDADD